MTLAQIRTKVRQRLDDGAAVYSNAEVDAGVNAAMRMFALLTLCIERQTPISLLPLQRFKRMLPVASDFLVPLRVELRASGALYDEWMFDQVMFDQAPSSSSDSRAMQLRPATVADFHAGNDQWLSATGDPKHYAAIGFDLLVFDRTVTVPSLAFVKYAALPAVVAADADIPEIPLSHHEDVAALVPFWLRVREGGSLHAETRAGLEKFVAGAQQLAGFVRARSLAQRYDRAPSEFTLADISRAAAARPDLQGAAK